ncbi:hypothetical protein PIB30_098500, partial [Stylosanthes scabra]|nr:hypothetical protein [Stylosanthes scabra]
GCLRSAPKEGREAELRVPLAKPPRPWMTESGQNGRVAIGAEDGTVTKGRIATTDLEPTEVAETILPPPKLLDLDLMVILEAALPYTANRAIEPEEGMWTAAGRTTTATMADGGLRARQLRRFFLLNSPPLLVAVFPWNCNGNGEEKSRDGWQWSVAANRVPMIAEVGA